MAKRALEIQPTEKPTTDLPDIAFAEAEVQKIADFINWVYTNGLYNMKLSDMKKVSGMLNDMHAHVAKIEKYIFEHRRVVAAKKAVVAE